MSFIRVMPCSLYPGRFPVVKAVTRTSPSLAETSAAGHVLVAWAPGILNASLRILVVTEMAVRPVLLFLSL